MSFNLDVIAKLLSPIIAALVGAIVKRYFEDKPKLLSYMIHASAISLNANTQVNSHSIVVRNAGKKAAHNVRIGHYSLPAFQISPPVSHTVIPESREQTAPLRLLSRRSFRTIKFRFPISTFRRRHGIKLMPIPSVTKGSPRLSTSFRHPNLPKWFCLPFGRWLFLEHPRQSTGYFCFL